MIDKVDLAETLARLKELLARQVAVSGNGIEHLKEYGPEVIIANAEAAFKEPY